MQAVILAGGRGIRMGEETLAIPKPMVKIGKLPILWHVMKNLYAQGIEDFIILVGYRGEIIRDFFRHYHEYIDPASFYGRPAGIYGLRPLEDWSVTVVDTGLDTPTGGRILQARNYVMGPFIMTYGDGLADVQIEKIMDLGTRPIVGVVTAVNPPGRFGALDISDREGQVYEFKEKSLDTTWINGGFFYFNPEVFQFLREDEMLEQGSVQRIMHQGLLRAYKHTGFWQCMDTQRERDLLESLWNKGEAPWKNWED